MYYSVHTGFVGASVWNVIHFFVCSLGKLVALLLAVIEKG
jgi:hypothetical protein